jgi:hypothetical protein
MNYPIKVQYEDGQLVAFKNAGAFKGFTRTLAQQNGDLNHYHLETTKQCDSYINLYTKLSTIDTFYTVLLHTQYNDAGALITDQPQWLPFSQFNSVAAHALTIGNFDFMTSTEVAILETYIKRTQDAFDEVLWDDYMIVERYKDQTDQQRKLSNLYGCPCYKIFKRITPSGKRTYEIPELGIVFKSKDRDYVACFGNISKTRQYKPTIRNKFGRFDLIGKGDSKYWVMHPGHENKWMAVIVGETR